MNDFAEYLACSIILTIYLYIRFRISVEAILKSTKICFIYVMILITMRFTFPVLPLLIFFDLIHTKLRQTKKI